MTTNGGDVTELHKEDFFAFDGAPVKLQVQEGLRFQPKIEKNQHRLGIFFN